MFEMCCSGSISCLILFLWKTAFSTLPSFWDSVNTLSLCPAGLGRLPLWDLLCWTLSQHSAQSALPAHALLHAQPFCCIIPDLRVGVLSPYEWMLAVCIVRHKQRAMETVVQTTPASKVLVGVRLQNGSWDCVCCGYTGTRRFFPGLMSLAVLKMPEHCEVLPRAPAC